MVHLKHATCDGYNGCQNIVDEEGDMCHRCRDRPLDFDDDEEYMTADRYADLTEPGLYDREPDEPGMDYGPDMDDF